MTWRSIGSSKTCCCMKPRKRTVGVSQFFLLIVRNLSTESLSPFRRAETLKRKKLLEIEMEYMKEMSQQKYNTMLSYFQGEGGRERVHNMALLFALSAVSVGAIALFVPLARKYLNKYLFSPRLISRVQSAPSSFSLFRSRPPPIQVTLRPALEDRMNRILKVMLDVIHTHTHNAYNTHLRSREEKDCCISLRGDRRRESDDFDMRCRVRRR